MADNANLTAGDGSLIAGADEIGGIKYPRVKVNFGADGSTSDVSTSNPLPVDGSGVTQPVSGTVAVTNAGTFPVQATLAAGATNIAKAEDAASANADVGVPAMAIQLATPADTAGTDGDYAMLQMSAGRLWCSSLITGTVTVGSHAVTNAGTFAVQATVAAGATNIAKAEDVASADADVGVPAMAVRKATPANTSGTDGDYEMLQVSAGRLWASSQAYGATAADAALTNPPITTGGRATNTNLAGMSTDGDVVDAMFDMSGRLVVIESPRELVAPQQTQISNSTSETTIVTAGASGVFNDISSITLTNTGASATKVTVKDATAGTTRWIGYVPAGDMRGIAFPIPLPQAAAANNWTATCGTATTALEVSVSYVKRK